MHCYNMELMLKVINSPSGQCGLGVSFCILWHLTAIRVFVVRQQSCCVGLKACTWIIPLEEEFFRTSGFQVSVSSSCMCHISQRPVKIETKGSYKREDDWLDAKETGTSSLNRRSLPRSGTKTGLYMNLCVTGAHVLPGCRFVTGRWSKRQNFQFHNDGIGFLSSPLRCMRRAVW